MTTEPEHRRDTAYYAFFKTLTDHVVDDVHTTFAKVQSAYDEVVAKSTLNQQHDQALNLQYFKDHENKRIKHQSNFDQANYEYKATYEKMLLEPMGPHRHEKVNDYLSAFDQVLDASKVQSGVFTKYTILKKDNIIDE
jgi:hypothetical protein